MVFFYKRCNGNGDLGLGVVFCGNSSTAGGWVGRNGARRRSEDGDGACLGGDEPEQRPVTKADRLQRCVLSAPVARRCVDRDCDHEHRDGSSDQDHGKQWPRKGTDEQVSVVGGKALAKTCGDARNTLLILHFPSERFTDE